MPIIDIVRVGGECERKFLPHPFVHPEMHDEPPAFLELPVGIGQAIVISRNDPSIHLQEAIREGILQAGILPALLASQQPVSLIGFLEGFVNPIIRQRGVGELVSSGVRLQ